MSCGNGSEHELFSPLFPCCFGEGKQSHILFFSPKPSNLLERFTNGHTVMRNRSNNQTDEKLANFEDLCFTAREEKNQQQQQQQQQKKKKQQKKVVSR